MHELGVTFSIMDTLEDVAKQNKLTHISSVQLELGEVSTVIPEYLTDCWKWACTKRDLFNDCKLKINTLKAITYCQSCQNKYNTVEHGKTCPKCGSTKTYLICGQEFNIKEIEAI